MPDEVLDRKFGIPFFKRSSEFGALFNILAAVFAIAAGMIDAAAVARMPWRGTILIGLVLLLLVATPAPGTHALEEKCRAC